MDNSKLNLIPIGNSPEELWLKTSVLLLREGNKKLNYEISNLVMILDCTIRVDYAGRKYKMVLDDNGMDYEKYMDPEKVPGYNPWGLQKLEKIKMDYPYSVELLYFREEFIFRFGKSSIDYAKNITFLEPEPLSDDDILGDYKYSSAVEGKWTKTYWSRMWNWEGNFNQIEQALKNIREGKNSKTISINVYHPMDEGKAQANIPRLLSLDIKPRNDGLYFTAFYRSMRISKSGLADFTALKELAEHISHRSGIVNFKQRRVNRITIMGNSVHLDGGRALYGELYNTKMVLNYRNWAYITDGNSDWEGP